jgi:hypothetical protein
MVKMTKNLFKLFLNITNISHAWTFISGSLRSKFSYFLGGLKMAH